MEAAKSIREELEAAEGQVPEAIYKYIRLQLVVNNDILVERQEQNKKWGFQRHNFGKWLAILTEEFGEVGQAMQPLLGLTTTKPTDAQDLYEELIQLAAVAQAIAEQVREERGLI
ncbi:hypothetical protein ACF5W4_11245 [Bacillota bacterium Lsc_1132]